jgi:hypothetical protein
MPSSLLAPLLLLLLAADDPAPLAIRGIYGGVPTQIFEKGQTLADYGINAVWIGSGSLKADDIARLRSQGAKVFAEFNTMHAAEYLAEHPDARPIGPDGQVSPPPDGWQGVCPTHPGYRAWRMGDFRRVLRDFEIDGIWLDYHHAHASWEQAEPNLPDTCFCQNCLSAFYKSIGRPLPVLGDTVPFNLAELRREAAGPLRDRWTAWRLAVFTDWVREFRQIVDETRPAALLGTFHCPWTADERDGALLKQLSIDLKAQAPYLDVLSPMPYHARFGHPTDPAWIGRQVAWLGEYLGIQGLPDDRLKIWPIVQLADWGEAVAPDQIPAVLDHGTRPPATGLTIFAWGGLASSWPKVEKLGEFYRSRRPE